MLRRHKQLVTALLGFCAAWMMAPPAQGDPSARQEQESGAAVVEPDDAAAELPALRELLEVDLALEALQRFGPRVAPGGDLAENGEALSLLARAHFFVGDEDGARHLLERTGSSPDSERFLTVGMAWLAMQRDDLDEALRALLRSENERTLPRYPDDPEALILLVRIFARRGDVFAAEGPAARFLSLAKLHPEAHTALHALAQAAIERGDFDSARELFQRRDAARQWQELLKARRIQARRSPDDPLPHLGLALLWMEVEEWARARARLTEHVQRWPNEARAWFHLAECRRNLREITSALIAYERALSLDSAHGPSSANRALLLIEVGRTAEAQNALEELVDGPLGKDARYAPAHLALARLLLDSEGEEAAQVRYAAYRALGGEEPLIE